MLALKTLLMVGGILMLLGAAALLAWDITLAVQFRRAQRAGTTPLPPEPMVRWRTGVALAMLAWAPLLLSVGIVVVPSGEAGVRISQTRGTRPGTLYPGVHFVTPMIDHVALYDTRDHIFTTGGDVTPEPAAKEKKEEVEKTNAPMNVQSKEGLNLGLAVTVRYHLDAGRLPYIHANLPQPVDTELVAPIVTATWRELIPNYTVREVFSTRRAEVEQRAAEMIQKKLGDDGIVVKEVMLRDVQLPPQYSQGLEQLLLKEQEDDRMGVETDIQSKQVKISELQAEAEKVQQVKQAEAQAAVRVLQAKGESDAMQYTLPLKEKQIEQSKLEAQARKEATIANAEADAQAKVIDSKAELERRNLLAEAEANRIRVTAKADTERMSEEGAVLKQNPLLINKIMAEKLSDKLQIMMVPADGRFFFNDLMKNLNQNGTNMDESESGNSNGNR